MEPIKFEDNIREKFEEREIEPSKDAWKKLHSKLDPTPNKNRTIWFAVAASFIGILIITSLLFNDEGSSLTNTTDEVVEKTESFDEIDENTEDLLLDDKTNSIASEESKPINKAEKSISIEPDIIHEKPSDLAKNSENLVKESVASNSKERVETTSSVKIENSIIESKVDEIIVQTQVIQKDKKPGSAEEINALLLKAQQDIQDGRIAVGKKKKVDAADLLYAVETEIETSFRDKVFEALGDGFEKVKTAVVERNN